MISTINYALGLLFRFLEFAIFLEIILSWVMPGKENQLTEIVHVFTEPFMRPGRLLQQKLMPGFMLDFSPIIAILILDLLRTVIAMILGVF